MTDEELTALLTDVVRSAPSNAYLEVGAETMARIQNLIPERGPRPWQVGLPDPWGIPIVSAASVVASAPLPPNGWRLAHLAPTTIREGVL
jgi:hypothetical protein